MNLSLGQHVQGYLEDGLAFRGRIHRFTDKKTDNGLDLVVVKTYGNSKVEQLAVVDSLIPSEVAEIKVNINTLIAQIRGCSEGSFKSTKDARDYTLRLVRALKNCTPLEDE